MPHNPYDFMETAFQAPPSSGYVPGYILESDPEEDPKEDPEEDDEILMWIQLLTSPTRMMMMMRRRSPLEMRLMDSTVTYTEVYSPFEDISDIGSLAVDGLPIMPHNPYDFMEAAFQAPPSSGYVPGPEHPPTPAFILELVYLEFMPPEDDVLPAEE
nr:hypothetical protein [Tanacetum cinerariifolium]